MAYERNHYVPRWYQKRFIPASTNPRRFCYLDLHPESIITSSGQKYTRSALRSLGPDHCFYEDNLYTTRLGSWSSMEIERRFFGPIDNAAPNTMEYFSAFEHPSAHQNAFQTIVEYLSVQKLRTPKGLAILQSATGKRSTNEVLLMMQQFRNVHCAIWAEAVWSIWYATDCNVKFLISDHPVTVYNTRCFPASKYCRDGL